MGWNGTKKADGRGGGKKEMKEAYTYCGGSERSERVKSRAGLGARSGSLGWGRRLRKQREGTFL